jgi:branched-chain amino acid aminotransferase
MAREINCDELTFSLYQYAHEMKMYESFYSEGEWDTGAIVDFHYISLSPAANILNYGQGIFEGLKAYYSVKEHVVLFRPEENGDRSAWVSNRFWEFEQPKAIFFISLAVQLDLISIM